MRKYCYLLKNIWAPKWDPLIEQEYAVLPKRRRRDVIKTVLRNL